MSEFQGKNEKRDYLLGALDRKITHSLVHKIPSFIETNHLTLATIIWGLMAVFGGYMAQNNINWLWLVFFMVLFQHITDLFDGVVGRERNTGLIKWGFYMDHLLDFFFLGALMIAYSFLLEAGQKIIMLPAFIIFGGFFVNSFLTFSATNRFQVSVCKISPSEIKITLLIFNIVLIFFGSDLLTKILPLITIIAAFVLIIVIYKTQRRIWKIDMKNKNT